MGISRKRSLFSNIPLSLVVVVPFVALVMGTVGLISYLSYQSEHKSVKKIVEQLLDNTEQQVNQELNRYFQTAHDTNQRHIAAIKSGVISLQNLDQLHRYLILQHQKNKYLTSFLFGTPQGDFRTCHRVNPKEIGNTSLIKSEDLPYEAGVSTILNDTKQLDLYSINESGELLSKVQTILNIDVRDRPWYRLAVETRKAGWSKPFQIGNSNLLALNAYAPFYDEAQNLLGVFSVNISLNQLSGFLGSLKVGHTGKIFIIERNGLLIANSTAKESYSVLGKPKLSDISKTGDLKFIRLSADEISEPTIQNSYHYLKTKFNNLEILKEHQILDFQIDGALYFLSINPYKDSYGLSWLVVTVVPESDFTAEINANFKQTLIMCGLALFTSIGIGLFISRRISRSLSHLTQATKSFSENRLEQSVLDTHITEVQILKEALHQMMIDLRDADQMRLNYQQDLEQQVAEKTDALLEAQRIARVGSWELDVTTGTMIWSAEIFRILRIDPTVELPKYPNVFERILPEDQIQLRTAIDRAITNGTPYNVEYGNFLPDGSICYLLSRGEAVFDEQGKVIKLRGTAQDISDRKQVEIALKQSEIRFLEISESSPANIYILVMRVDGSFYFEHMSRAIEVIHELKVEEILTDASLILNCIYPDDIAGYEAAVRLSLETMQPFHYEWRIVNPSGKIKWVQGNSRPRLRDNGDIAWYGVVIDISDRKQVEIQLQQSEETNRAILHAIPDLLLRVDKNGVCYNFIPPVNAQSEKYLPIKINLAEVLPPDLLRFELQQIDKALVTGQLQVWEHQILKLGKICYEEVRVSPCSEEECLIIVRDISDRKQAEIALQISESRFRAIAASSPGAIYTLITYPDGSIKFEYMSAIFEEILEIKIEQILNRASVYLDQIHPQDREAYYKASAYSRTNLQPFQHEWRIITPSGKIKWLQANSRPICRDNDEIAWHGVILDVTARKQAEIELAKAKEKAEADTKAKSDFLANMSHEIRTPMNGVIGMTQLLETTILTEEQADFVKTIKDSGEALLTVINDILDFSKIESGKLEIEANSFNLQEVVIAVCKLLESQANDKHITLQYVIAPEIPTTVIGDYARLRQILLNLVGNAVKFTQQGQVSILVSGKKLFTPQLSIPEGENLERYQLKFMIADTGIGIKGDRIVNLFQPFTQADASISRKYGGTGLGLAISKRLVELMGGTIWVESFGQFGGNPLPDWQPLLDNQGSIFHFTLSVATTENIRQSLGSATQKTAIDKKFAEKFPLRILLVEDNQVNQMVACSLFKRLGYKIDDIANNGLEAVQAIKSHTYDLILMDLQMPEMDGLTATKIIRTELMSQVPIVAMTADVMPEDRQACLDVGMNDYISKPINLPEIMRVVSSINSSLH